MVQVNTQENTTLAQRFNVRGIPALYLLREGRVIDQLAGANSVDAVLIWFRQHGSVKDTS